MASNGPIAARGAASGGRPSAPTTGPLDLKDIPPAPWTYFISLNGDNGLSRSSKVDFAEMLAAKSLEGQANIIVLSDTNRGKSKLVYLQKDAATGQMKARPLYVPATTPLGKLIAKTGGELDNGDPRSLRAALDFVQAGLPSKHFALELWGHGNAWNAVSYDDANRKEGNAAENALTMPELKKVLHGLKYAPDVVYFDACRMASLEVAHTLKAEGVGWLAASEETVPSQGNNYTRLFRELGDAFEAGATPKTVAQTMARVHASASAPFQKGTTTSATDLGQLPALEGTLDSLTRALVNAGGRDNPLIAKAYAEAKRFKWQFDLGHFATLLSKKGPAEVRPEANAVLEALARTTVEYGKTTNVHGLSVFAPAQPVPVGVIYFRPDMPWSDLEWPSWLPK